MSEKLTAYGLILVQFVCLGLLALTGPLLVSGALYRGLFGAGILLGLWAIGTMRIGNFNVTHQIKTGGRHVVRGPYQYIRHPMYTAVLWVMLILVINEFSSLRLALWAILLVDLLVKISFEEKVLVQHFEDYAAYEKRTKRLIPFVY